MILTRDRITFTSTSTPTITVRVTPEWTPNSIMDTATANSKKKLLVPINAVEARVNLKILKNRYLIFYYLYLFEI